MSDKSNHTILLFTYLSTCEYEWVDTSSRLYETIIQKLYDLSNQVGHELPDKLWMIINNRIKITDDRCRSFLRGTAIIGKRRCSRKCKDGVSWCTQHNKINNMRIAAIAEVIYNRYPCGVGNDVINKIYDMSVAF